MARSIAARADNPAGTPAARQLKASRRTAAGRAWRALDLFVARESVRWAARAHTVLLAEGGRAAAAYETEGEAAALAAVSEAAWRAYINTLWLAIVPRAAELVDAWVPKAAVDPFIDAAVRYLRLYGPKRAAELSARSRAGIAEQIRIGIQKHESRSQIAARIRKHYKSISPGRAKTIARTEVHAAANYGSLTAAVQTQIPLYKVWIATPDGRTRDAHAKAEGQRQLLAEPFDIGGYHLMFPGDTSRGAPAELTVNCRCALRYERAVKPVPAAPARRRRAA